MDSRSSVFYVGIPLGKWFGAQVRISVLFPLLIVVCVMKLGTQIGLMVSAILFVSVLIHEFAHIFAARATGGEGDEILIWPLGGLAFTRPANTISSEFLTAGAGPLSNFILFAMSAAGIAVLMKPFHWDIFDPLALPHLAERTETLHALLLLSASINFKLMSLNLLPAIPLDGGQMANCLARNWMDAPVARIRTLQLGQVVSLLLAIAGVIVQDSLPVFLAFLLAVYNLHDYFLAMIADQMDDASFGQDYGIGYSASNRPDRETRQPGLIARWRLKREEERRQREEQERVETERRLDELLDKVHREGMNALTDVEKRFLSRASARYRSHEH
jgi:stage IV sporulation protein FB